MWLLWSASNARRRALGFVSVGLGGVVHDTTRKPGVKRCAAITALPVAFDPPSAFALGNAGNASCPSGTATVLIPADCQKAAEAAARPYGGSVRVADYRDLLPGCVWLTVGVGSFFFINLYGYSGNQFAQSVCAGAPCSKQEQNPSSECLVWWYVCVCVRARVCLS